LYLLLSEAFFSFLFLTSFSTASFSWEPNRKNIDKNSAVEILPFPSTSNLQESERKELVRLMEGKLRNASMKTK
jgi:hypothetical protein